MQKISQQTKAVQLARDSKNPEIQFTRRLIALAAVASIIVLPIVVGAIAPYVPMSYGLAEGGVVTWTTGTGIIIPPVHSHLMYAIIGLYFGASSIK